MVENKRETAENLSGMLNQLEFGGKITDDEAMLLIREGYFPAALEGVEIILEEIGLKDEYDENRIENKLQYLSEEYLRILRRFICEVLKEGTVDYIKVINKSMKLEPKSRKLETILRIVEEKLTVG
jgi:hypothetical protein